LTPVRDYFGEWRAVVLTADAVDVFIVKRLEGQGDQTGASPATVNRSTQLLRQAFSLAIERGRLLAAPHIRHLSEKGNERQGFFLDTQFRALESNLPIYLRDYARFGYLTGWRKGEIASLRWEDVIGDEIRLRAENSKNGRGRTIALDGELADLIERRRSARRVEKGKVFIVSDLVFHHNGEPIVDIRKAWATACKMAGIEGKLFHDLRRTAVRNMVRAGVPEAVAMSISGHKTRSMFDRYDIVSGKDQRDAMQRTQSYLITAAEEEKKRQPAQISAAVQ
jgi:integrase